MMKKMLAVVMVLAVVLSSFTFMTAFASDATYLPKELMLQTSVSTTGDMMTLSWRNPTASALDDVKLYDITNGTDELLADKDKNSLTAKTSSAALPVLRNGGGVVQYVLSGLSEGTYYKYKLVFSFNDGTADKTYFLSGAPEKSASEGKVNLTANLYLRSGKTGLYPFLPLLAKTVTEDDGNTALKLTSNMPYVSGNWSQIAYNISGLTNGNKYKVGFRYKAENGSKADFSFVGGSKTAVNQTNGEWVDFEAPDYTASGTSATFRINFENPIEYIIFDDFYAKEIKADGTLGENLIADGGLDTLKTYKTLADAEPIGTPGEGNATVSWANDGNASYYKFYKDGELFGIFYPDPSGTTSVNVKGLTNDVEYTFGVEPFSKNFTPNTVKTVTVTPEKTEEPQPENYMISNLSVNPYTFASKGTGATVSFINPKVSDITSAALYGEDGEKITDFSTASGAANVYTITNLTNGELYKYKIKVTTESKGLNEYDVAVKPATTGDGSYALTKTPKYEDGRWLIKYTRANANTPYPPVDFKVVENPDASPDSTEKDYVIKVVSNISEFNGGNTGTLYLRFNKQFASDTQYRLKFKYKCLSGAEDTSVCINNKELTTIGRNSDGWQSAECDFTTADITNNSYNELQFKVRKQLEGLYIDKVEIVAVTDGKEGENIVANGDADSIEADENAVSVGTPLVTAGDSSAEIEYTLTGSCEAVKIYEKTEFGLNLVAVEQGAPVAGKISLGALENNKEHTFVMTAVNTRYVEGAGYEFKVTPIPEPIVISDYVLTKDGTKVTSISQGTHTASVSIKNNSGGTNQTAQLIAAVYDGKKLYAVKASDKTTIPMDGAEYTLTAEGIEIPDTDGDYSLKLMLWNGLDEMIPLKPFAPYTK